MRIIKAGPIAMPIELTCRKCKCLFEIVQEDYTLGKTVVLVQDLRDGDFLRMDCPQCKTQVTYDSNKAKDAGWLL